MFLLVTPFKSLTQLATPTCFDFCMLSFSSKYKEQNLQQINTNQLISYISLEQAKPIWLANQPKKILVKFAIALIQLTDHL